MPRLAVTADGGVVTTGIEVGLMKFAANGEVAWRALVSESLFASGLGVAGDGHVYVARVANRDGTYALFTTRVAPDGGAASEVCSFCGYNLAFAVGPNDEVAYLRRIDPDAPVPPDGVAVVDGHQEGLRGGDLVLPDITGALAYAPDGTLVVAGGWQPFSQRAGEPNFILALRKRSEVWRREAPAGLDFVGFSTRNGLAVARDGTIVLVARLAGSGVWGADAVDAGAGRNYLLALSAGGEPRWARPLTALPRDENVFSVAVAASGTTVHLVGANGCDTFSVHKYDVAGTWLGQRDLRMSSCLTAAQANHPAITAGPTAVYVAGALAGTLQAGAVSVTAMGTEGSFLVKLTP